MNNENRPKTDQAAPFCELIGLCSDRSTAKKVDFETFDSWIDLQLQILEKKFAHNVTRNSLRSEFSEAR